MTTATFDTRTLATDGAEIVYDVYGPLPTADGRPPLLLIGQPMDAAGFRSLAPLLSDRTVVTYDPRGLGRSTRSDGRADHDPRLQAADLHALIAEIGGPVDLFGSSGGAVTGLALVTAHPDDVRTLVAHEPPLLSVVPDSAAAERASQRMTQVYQRNGFGAGMAAFIALGSWKGEYTDEYFAQPDPDPAAFGLPTEDDGSRDDPLLSELSAAVSHYEPDVAALTSAPTRVVIAVGEESTEVFTGRAALATADALGQTAAVFPGDHGGFSGGEFGFPGKPAEFAQRLGEVLGTS